MTLRDAVRRLLSILGTLVVVSAVALWALASFVERTPSVPRGPFSGLPAFFNPSPQSVRELSISAMREVARGGPGAAGARTVLVHLGGAALPFVLPAFDTLDPRARARVAECLVPVAERMNVVGRSELESPDQAVLFWTRFWQDRAIDFRSTTLRRLVSRLAERSSELRREDVIHVDTFALPALIAALGQVSTPDDVDRVRRLGPVIDHVLGVSWATEARSDVESTRRLVRRYNDFWDREGEQYVAFDGPRRLTALVAQTQYGKWLRGVLRGGLGRMRDGRSAWAAVQEGWLVTALLLASGLGAGFLGGVAWTVARWRTRSSASAWLSWLLCLAGVAVPTASVVAGLRGLYASAALGALIVAATAVAWVSHALYAGAKPDMSEAPAWRALAFATPLGPTLPPLVIGSVILVETGFRLDGLGRMALSALTHGDVNAWMAACLGLATATLLLRQLAHLLLTREARRS